MVSWILLLGGLFACCGAAFDWDFFMSHRRAQLFVRLFGRNGARVFYAVLGVSVATVGLYQLMGLLPGR